MRNDEKLTDRLLPCPFCGGKPNEHVFFAGLLRPGRYEVRCIPCNVKIYETTGLQRVGRKSNQIKIKNMYKRK
jgi:hypothetical protein